MTGRLYGSALCRTDVADRARSNGCGARGDPRVRLVVRGLHQEGPQAHLALILRLSLAMAAPPANAGRPSPTSPASPRVCASSGVSVELPLWVSLPAELPSSLLPVFSDPCDQHMAMCSRGCLHVK